MIYSRRPRPQNRAQFILFLSLTFQFALLVVMGSQKRFLAYYLNKSVSEITCLARYSARSRCIPQCSREWHRLLEVSGSSSREPWFCMWQQRSNTKEPGAAADHTLRCIKLTGTGCCEQDRGVELALGRRARHSTSVHQQTGHLSAASRTTYLITVSTRQKGLSRKMVVTQAESLPKEAAVQIFGCSECLSLLVPEKGGKDFTCVWCEQVYDLLGMLAALKGD